MRFRTVVPEHCEAGGRLRIRISDGTDVIVTIPSDLGKDDSLIFELQTDQLKNPKALLKEEQKLQQSTKTSKRQQRKQKNHHHHHKQQQQQAITTAQVETRSNSDDSIKTTTASLVLVDDDDDDDDGDDNDNDNDDDDDDEDEDDDTETSVDTKKKTFLEREIIDCQDFFLALTVGLLVGSAIVFGFFLGIVYSTEAIYAVHPIEKPKQRSQQQRRTKFPNSGPSGTSAEPI